MKSVLLLLLLSLCALAQEPLTPDQAVELALSHNPSAQALRSQLEAARGERDQAGLLVNPSFSITVGAEHREYEVSWNVLDLFRRSDRARLADTRFRQAGFEQLAALLDLTLEVKRRFHRVQSLSQAVAQLELVWQAAQAASELQRRQFEAGSLPELVLAQQDAATLGFRIELDQARLELERERLALNLVLGQDPGTPLQVVQLPPPPDKEAALEGLEALALEHRPDVALARLEVEASQQAVALASGGLLDEVSVGYNDSPDISGPNVSVPVPLFDRRQGEVAGLRARNEASRHQLAALERQARTEVRQAHNQLLAQRLKTEQLGAMIEQRRRILYLARPYYDSMLLGIYPLLEFRQEVARTRRELIESTADYWVARAELERAVGAPIP